MPSPILVDWSQRLSLSGVVDPTTTPTSYDVLGFGPLANPMLARREKTYRLLTQSGEATAWHGRYKPPAPLFADRLVGEPQAEYERLDDLAWRTTWTYVMAIEPDQWDEAADFSTWLEAATRWPTSVSFW